MDLLPKKFKYKKYQTGQLNYSINKKNNIKFGNFALKATEPGRITSKQIEAGRRFIKKKIKPFKGIVKVLVKLRTPISYKPLSIRMGRGKGKIKSRICSIKEGQLLYGIYCSNVTCVKDTLLRVKHKLSVNTRIYQRIS